MEARNSRIGALDVPGRPRRSLLRDLYERWDSFLESGNLSMDRNFLIVRPAIAILVAASLFVQGSSLPGRTAVFSACAVACIYNGLFGYLVLKRRLKLLRGIALFVDNLIVIVPTIFVYREMGNAGYESDLWLLFLTLIVTNALNYGPLGSLVMTTLWTGLFVGVMVAFFDPESYSRQHMPMRLVFFIMTGFCSISLANEIRKRSVTLERKSKQTLSMLANIVEARDTDAGQHLRHIERYSRVLALQMGLPERHANEIAYAAMIHDVGKAQVPDAILQKPGPLTPAERREIEKHTIWGYELLAENEEFATACDVARAHHERWDGTGYPDGLGGESIPLAARITAVADVYDALVSERPYKRAWPRTDAIDEIRRLRGTHLDPRVVDAFLELYECGVLQQLEEQMRFESDQELFAA
jgi:HD-GYP domain-containing protein (c-di-GMP phosphodiesterase class II)